MKKPLLTLLSLILIWSVSYAQNIKGVVSKSITTQAPPPANAPVIQLNISSNQSSVTIPDNFQGLSYETTFLTNLKPFLNANNTVLIQLIKNLSPGVLRVGGNSSDIAVWTGGKRSSNTGANLLTTTDIDNFSAFAKTTGWPVIWGLNLAIDSINYSANADSSAKEALYLKNSLQNNLIAFQIGNEPDIFHDGARASTYNYTNYQTEWERYRAAIINVFTNPPMAGPDVSYNQTWITSFAKNEHQNINLLDGHYYVTGPGSSPSINCASILGNQNGLINYLKSAQASSAPYNLKFRFSECNSIYGGGKYGVSDVFAASLWALDFMWTAASYGVQGVNFHGASSGAYTPIATVKGIPTPRPEYYAMLAFKYGTTIKNIVPITINNPKSYNTSAYACSKGQQTNITLINKDTVNNLSYNITLLNNAQNIQVLRLQAPTIHSKSGVQFAGDSVHADGTFKLGAIENYVVQNSTFNVNVPAASAALVIVNPSNDATLSNLVPSAGTLSPTFIATTTSYAETVSNGTNSISITPTTNDVNATVTVNGIAVNTATASASIPLNFGLNSIPITVTAQDGVTKQTYTVNITRALSTDATLANFTLSSGTLSPAFSSNVTSYTTIVATNTSSISITPTTNDVNATVTVNGITVNTATASASIPLNFGLNSIPIIVTAQDGVTKQTYTVNITRALSTDATLANFTLSSGTLSPAFSSNVTSYTAIVATNTSSISITPTTNDVNATVTVNGITVNTATASASIPLNFGLNSIPITVTAQDGVTKQTYTVNITRALSTDATLANFTLSSGILSPAFISNVTSYTATVATNTSSISITPTTNDVNATVTVNGIAVNTATASASIPLNFGLNSIPITVTAQDGVTKQTYTVNITRALSTDATLANFTLSSGTLSPAFSSNVTSYTTIVATNTNSISITPTTNDVNATVTVNGITVNTATASASIPLNFGLNSIPITVTAQDGVTKQTYTVNITRALSTDATLANFTLSSGILSPAFISNVTSYTATVATNTSSISITPTTNDVNATVTVNGIAVNTATASASIPLNFGLNSIPITVTAQDGVTIQKYTLNVNRVFSLPSTNFNIAISSETCNGSSNGSVVVTAAANNNYTAVLTGNGINTTQQFTSTTTFSNLPAGTYTLTFTIDGQANYSSTYTVTVTQPQPLSVFAKVNNAAGNIDLALSGGTVYYIKVNNKTYTTTESSFSVPLEQGNNALQVTTDRECQGIFSKLINPSLNITPYPIPFESTLNLNLGSDNIEKVSVRIYSTNTGMQVYTADYQNQSGVLQLDLSKLAKGVYSLHLILNNNQQEFKVIK